MIIHSIVPIEEIFSTNQWQPDEQCQIIKLYNIKAEIRLVEENIYEIQRIYSTDIRDYLKPELQPGARVIINYQVEF